MKFDQYPTHYPEMFERAFKEPVRLHFTTKAKASAFRTELYKYRYAVRDALTPGDMGLKQFYDDLMKIALCISPDTTLMVKPAHTLILRKKKLKFVEKIDER